MTGNYVNIGDVVPHIGRLDKRVTIQTLTSVRTDSGAQVPTYVDLCTVWAQVKYPRTGNSEEMLTDQQMTVKRIEVTIRYRGDIVEKMRMVYEDEVYDILFTQILGRHKFETIMCELRK